MENKMKMPANYNVMNEEEMTYTTGGFDPIGAIASVAGTAFGIWNLYNYYKGMVATRNYVASHKGQDTAALLEGGLNTYVNYLKKDLVSAFKGVCAGSVAVGLWPITALVVITA